MTGYRTDKKLNSRCSNHQYTVLRTKCTELWEYSQVGCWFFREFSMTRTAHKGQGIYVMNSSRVHKRRAAECRLGSKEQSAKLRGIKDHQTWGLLASPGWHFLLRKRKRKEACLKLVWGSLQFHLSQTRWEYMNLL